MPEVDWDTLEYTTIRATTTFLRTRSRHRLHRGLLPIRAEARARARLAISSGKTIVGRDGATAAGVDGSPFVISVRGESP